MTDTLETFARELGELLGVGAQEEAVRRVSAVEHSSPLFHAVGRAAILAAAGDGYEAMEWATRAQAMAPDHPIVLQYCAITSRLAGDLPAAVAFAERAVVRDHSARSHNTLGRLLLDSRRFADAEQALRRGLEWEPDNSALLAALGAACSGIGDDDQGVHYTSRAYDVNPEDGTPLRNLMDLCAERGWALGAMAVARQMLDGPIADEARVALCLVVLSLAQRVAAAFPERNLFTEADEIIDLLVDAAGRRPPAVRLMVARHLVDVGRAPEAEALVASVSTEGLSAPDRANRHYTLGLLAGLEGDPEGALRQYEASVNADPQRWDAATNALNILLDRGDPSSLSEAAGLINQVPVLMRLSKPPLRFNEGLVLERIGRTTEAAEIYAQVAVAARAHPDLAQLAHAAETRLSQLAS